MNVSLSWLRQYIDTKDLSPETIGDILTSTGLEVEGMEEVETIPGGLRGLVVGEVKECGKHPGADRLSLTKVDVGGDELISIVCGAPNVAAGQKVVVATVGAELHPVEGDPFTIKKGKIRGEVSEGMICAEDEIGLGHSHDGIIVLPADATVGQLARDYYGVETDYVYEIGLTPNRSDATNHLGVAYDLAAALRVNHQHEGKVQPPSVDAFAVANTSLQIPVEVRNTEACPRYSGVTISNLTIKEIIQRWEVFLTTPGLPKSIEFEVRRLMSYPLLEMGDHDQALRELKLVLEYGKAAGDDDLLCNALGELATTYRQMGQIDKLLKTARERLVICQRLDKRGAVLNTSIQIGAAFLE